MLPYVPEIKVSVCNYSVSEWYPAYRDTPELKRVLCSLHAVIFGTCMPDNVYDKKRVRDGPFDIQGGAGIFPRDKLFFSLFLLNKLFIS